MRYAPLGHARRMSQFAATMTMLGSHRVLQALRPHARPLILACGLLGALLVWAVPAAPTARCMMAGHAALGWQGATSLSIVLTMLAWYVHKPVLQRVQALRQGFARD